MPELIAGELVAAAVVDARVWESQGDISPDGIYLTGQPGPALPFILFRAWKIPVGIVQEEVRLFGPSGRMIFRWGPEYRRMAGMFDLTTEVDRVPHAVFDESGTYVASFVVDGQVLGEIEVPIYVQAEPPALDKERRGRAEEVRRDLGRRRSQRATQDRARVVRLQERQGLRAVAARAGARRADDPRGGHRTRVRGDHPSEAPRHSA